MNFPNLDYKKIFLTIGLLVISAFFAFLIYFVFLRSVGVETALENENYNENYNENINTKIPEGGLSNRNTNMNRFEEDELSGLTNFGENSPLKELTTDRAKGLIISSNGYDALFYNREDGKFYKVDQNGKTKLLSEKTFFRAENIVWSDDKKKVIVEYPDGANIVYDFEKEEQTTMPTNWKEFSFSKSGDKIISKNIGISDDDNVLVVTDAKTGHAKVLSTLGENIDNFTVTPSPDNRVAGILAEPMGVNESEVYFLGFNEENFKAFEVSGTAFSAKWSADGNIMLYNISSSITDWKPSLWISDKNGNNRRELMLQTWVDKCIFYSRETLYCAVPQKLRKMAGIDPTVAIIEDDDIYKINLNSGKTKKIDMGNVDAGFSMANLAISKSENFLYFTDQRSGRIYQVKLP